MKENYVIVLLNKDGKDVKLFGHSSIILVKKDKDRGKVFANLYSYTFEPKDFYMYKIKQLKNHTLLKLLYYFLISFAFIIDNIRIGFKIRGQFKKIQLNKKMKNKIFKGIRNDDKKYNLKINKYKDILIKIDAFKEKIDEHNFNNVFEEFKIFVKTTIKEIKDTEQNKKFKDRFLKELSINNQNKEQVESIFCIYKEFILSKLKRVKDAKYVNSQVSNTTPMVYEKIKDENYEKMTMMADDMHKSPPNYSALRNNCIHVVLKVLQTGGIDHGRTTTFPKTFYEMQNDVVASGVNNKFNLVRATKNYLQ